MGGGRSPHALSHALAFGARLRSKESGCQLPDANLPGKWSSRPLSRAGRAVTRHGSRVRLLRSSTPAARSLPRTERPAPPPVKLFSGAGSTRGRPPLLKVRWPQVTGLASYPSGRFLFTVGRSRFSVRPKQEVLSGFACRTRSPYQPGPCASRSRLGTLRRGRLAGPASTCWFPVASLTSVQVTGIETDRRNPACLSHHSGCGRFLAPPPCSTG